MRSRNLWSILATVTVIVALGAGLSACGRRGSLERPPEAAAAQQAEYPMVKTRKGPTVPERPFVLDPLL
ncbi:MAG: hypothetical protein C0606_10370 [Hyphomicrobiales bacterium]|nr:MAG: hypothetical protein C0606_10370 [Hyphomicrobiales bacterium]